MRNVFKVVTLLIDALIQKVTLDKNNVVISTHRIILFPSGPEIMRRDVFHW